MSYLQHEHIEKCYYARDDSLYLIPEKKTFLLPDLQQYIEKPPANNFLEVGKRTFAETTNVMYLEQEAGTYLEAAGGQYSKELQNEDKYLVVSRNEFFEADAEAQHLLMDRVHHVEEDLVHHVEEDTAHHLEESDGETSDDENEDFCHLIDFNTRLPPMWERKENPKTKLIEYYDAFTKKWQQEKPRILERFEVFDLTEEELMVAIARYDHGDSRAKLSALRQEYKGDHLHRSKLQPVALDALRVWKHEIESKVLHSGVMAANYEEKGKMASANALDHFSAAERKQKRLELLRKQEDARYKTQEQQRQQNQARFQQQNLSRAAQQQQFRRQVSAQRQMRVNEEKSSQQHKLEEMAAHREELDRAKQEEEQERYKKEIAKEHEIKILNFLTEKSNGFKSNVLPTMYTVKYEEDWEPEIWFDNPMFKDDIVSTFESMHLRDEIVILKSGYTTHIMHQKHYTKLQIQGYSDDEIVPMLSLTTTIDEALRKLKDEKLAGQTSVRKKQQSVRNVAEEQSSKARKSLKKRKSSTRKAVVQRKPVNTVSKPKPLYQVTKPKPAFATPQPAFAQPAFAQPAFAQPAFAQPAFAQPAFAQPSFAAPAIPPAVPVAARGVTNGGLPEFWEAKRTPQGRLYFIDHRTKRTTWDDPRPLPSGWRSGKTPAGKTYYINDITKTTAWQDPRPALHV